MTATGNKTMNRFLVLLLLAAIVVSVSYCPVTVFADTDTEINEIENQSKSSDSSNENANHDSGKIYETYKEGTCGVEIGILSDNVIKLESESLVFDFSHVSAPLDDDLRAVTRANYVLTNTTSKEIRTSIAVPEILRLEKVTIEREEEDFFESGRSIMVDGESLNGLIFANTTIEKLRRDSVYDNFSEILSHVDYKVFFDEGFSLYSEVLQEHSSGNASAPTPENDTVNYYKVSDDGELYLCSVIYDLSFAPGESRTLEVTGSIMGEMNRATKYTDMGTSYSFTYVGDTLNSFYNIGEISITFALPEENLLPMLECDAPRYLNDDVWTIRYKGNTGNFTFTLGERLTKEQKNDIYTTFGPGRVLINVVEVFTATLVLVSGYYIFYSVKKRKESGIGARR